jgi:phospholipase C
MVVIVQQSRSFDNLFVDFPGTAARNSGPCAPAAWCKNGTARLKPITLQTTGKPGLGVVIPNSLATFRTEYNRGKMDGFDLIRFGSGGTGPPAKLYPYAYVERSEIKPYWDLAKQYALADHMFSTEQAGGFAAGQVLIAGSTALNRKGPYVVGVTAVGGCDAQAGATTILSNGRSGPPPCFTWNTMAGLLDAKGVSWKYYTVLCSGRDSDIGCFWNAFEAIKAVRYGKDWSRNVSVPNTNIFSDIKNDKLPAVSWVTPTLANSDDSASGSKSGPSWVSSIVNALKRSPYWKSTAIVIVWGDWGGYFEDIPPPSLDPIGLSFRVPMLVVSPYAKRHYVSHTQYELASILKFIESNWELGTLGTTDQRSTSISDMFDFTR